MTTNPASSRHPRLNVENHRRVYALLRLAWHLGVGRFKTLNEVYHAIQRRLP